MESKNLLKSLIVIGLSLMLIISITNLVFATDSDDDFDWENAIVENDTTNTNSSGNTLNTVDSTNTNSANTNSANTNTNSANTNTNTNSANTNTNNVVSTNELAYTGSGNSGIIAIIAVAGIIVTIYSYVKIKEYKNI